MHAPEYRRSLDAYLRSAKDLARLTAHADRLLALQQTYAQIAPHYLAEASQVANYKSGKVVIHAASGAVAAKINQLEPRLRGEFSKRGWEVTEITVRVQVRTRSEVAPPPIPAREISGAVVMGLARLGSRLPEGSALGAALKRLLDHARHRR